MKSSSSRQAATLASIIDAEKLVPPPRARALLASLAHAAPIPAGPATVREWCEAIIVARDESGAERATFANGAAPLTPADRGASVARHVDALRAAAVAMLWGRESAQGADGHLRFPRLRMLLVDQWDETRSSCDGPDKLMIFVDATLALDRAAEPRAGREAFKTLSLPTVDAVRRDVHVGTIGKPFEAIVDTGKFKKGDHGAPSDAAGAADARWSTPRVSAAAQPAVSLPATSPAAPAPGSMTPVIVGVVAVVVLGALAIAFVAR